MRRIAPRGLGALGAFTQPTQTVCASSSSNAAAGVFRRWLADAAASAPTTGGAARLGAASASGGSGWNPFAAVMFIPSVVCGCLAYWQYERMNWKNELIALRKGISEAEPKDLFEMGEPHEYDKVQVRGRLLHEYSLFVGPRPRSVPGSGVQPGYLVVTPMLCSDRRGVVLVNRGWVPAAWKEEAEAAAAAKAREAAAQTKEKAAAAAAAAARPTAATAASTGSNSWWGWLSGGGGTAQPQQPSQQPQPTQQQQAKELAPEPEVVVGVIQFDEQPSQFMPDNKPEADEFHFIQRETMARVLGLPPDTPLIMAVSTDPAAVQVVQKRSPVEDARSASVAAASSSPPTYPAPKHEADLVRFTTMPGDHLNYALIWVALCVTLAVMGRTAVTQPLRGARIVEGPGGSARDAWRASQAN